MDHDNPLLATGTSRLAQTITFAPLPDKTFGDLPFDVAATASSGLAVTFRVSGTCTLSGSTVTLTGAGSCTVTASQAGNSNYLAAPEVPQSFAINAPAPNHKVYLPLVARGH